MKTRGKTRDGQAGKVTQRYRREKLHSDRQSATKKSGGCDVLKALGAEFDRCRVLS